MKRRALYFEAPYHVAVREEDLAEPGPGQLLVKTLVSAISAGTELLIYRGQVPPDMKADETIDALPGTFDFPLKYGYAAVGEVVGADPQLETTWIGKKVFVFNPPESHFLASVAEVNPLPPGMPVEDAVFFPNVETAVTLAHDGKPAIGEQVTVFGQGIVGLLLTSVLARLPLASLVTLDKHVLRRRASLDAGAHFSIDPLTADSTQQVLSRLQGDRVYQGADLAYEVSGNPEGLEKAISVTGYNGRVVIGSWYGLKKTSLSLGASFHRSRVRLISSQVSTIEPEFRGRWNKDRLRGLVWQVIEQIRPSGLITHRIHLSKAEEAYKLINGQPEKVLQVLLTY
jgi:2-desacetyl-2-hydroxyethyl bacteriochlorophyllide A dehydrogenase